MGLVKKEKKQTKTAMWSILSAILNLGNLQYQDAGSGKPAAITNAHVIQTVANLLQVKFFFSPSEKKKKI